MRASDPLSAELQMVVRHHMGAGNYSQFSARTVYFRVSLTGLRLAQETSKTQCIWGVVSRSYQIMSRLILDGFLIRWYDLEVMKTGDRISLEEVGTCAMYLGLYLVPFLYFRSDMM